MEQEDPRPEERPIPLTKIVCHQMTANDILSTCHCKLFSHLRSVKKLGRDRMEALEPKTLTMIRAPPHFACPIGTGSDHLSRISRMLFNPCDHSFVGHRRRVRL